MDEPASASSSASGISVLDVPVFGTDAAETQAMCDEVLDDLADKFRKANSAIDLAALVDEDEVDLEACLKHFNSFCCWVLIAGCLAWLA